MLPLFVEAAKLGQFIAGVIAFGSPLFFLYAFSRQDTEAAGKLRWIRPLLLSAEGLLLLASLTALVSQTATMAGSLRDAFGPDGLGVVVSSTAFGVSTLARAALAVLAILLLIGRPRDRSLWVTLSLIGAAQIASLAWGGHGAADTGAGGVVHLVSDILHLLAAGTWLGAVVMLLGLLWTAESPPRLELEVLHRALHGFSGVGSGVVAVLLVTGVANSWFLVGPNRIDALFTTLYGQLLLAKLTLFGLMLVLAAANRWRLAPALANAISASHGSSSALAALKRSLLLETAAALGILILVSLLGTIAPISAA